MGKEAIFKVDRSKTQLIHGHDKHSDFVNLPPEDCVSLVWELTQELWSLKGDDSAQRRLQRDVAVLRKK